MLKNRETIIVDGKQYSNATVEANLDSSPVSTPISRTRERVPHNLFRRFRPNAVPPINNEPSIRRGQLSMASLCIIGSTFPYATGCLKPRFGTDEHGDTTCKLLMDTCIRMGAAAACSPSFVPCTAVLLLELDKAHQQARIQ
eukprot:IDg11833t1